MSADLGIYLVIDGSGSMSGQRNEVVQGVNEFIVEQQADAAATNDDIRFSLTTFDSNVMQIYDGEDISLVRPVTVRDTFIGGGTALLDALGRTLTNAEDAQADRNIVVVYTDGEENSSREFTRDQIKALIERLEASGSWQFIYLGAEFAEFADEAAAIAMSSTINTSKRSVGQTWKNVSATTSHYHHMPNTATIAGSGGLIASATLDGVDWDAVKDVPTGVVDPFVSISTEVDEDELTN